MLLENTEYIKNQDQLPQVSKLFNQPQGQNQISNIKLEEILMTQNKILIQILETQVKIIQGLKL
jgi:hypothetical protein